MNLLDRLRAADPERIRVLRYPSTFNFSAINNFAAREARGEVLILLNNDTEVLTDGWLTTLIGLATRPRAGAVGALMLFPDGRIQHCGIALGMGSWPGRIHGIAGLLFSGARPEDVPSLLHAFDRRSGAVTAACLAVRRDRYLGVGGMDEKLHTEFNDVDLCLKLAARGFPTLFTPHVRILHHESASRVGRPIDPREVELMYDRWGDRLAYDPFVSPHIDPAGPRPRREAERAMSSAVS
jgi:GT2 family glycosyltransferase